MYIRRILHLLRDQRPALMNTLLRSPPLLILAFTLAQPLSQAQAGEPGVGYHF